MTFDDLDVGRCPDCGFELEYNYDGEGDKLYCPECDKYFEEWEL